MADDVRYAAVPELRLRKRQDIDSKAATTTVLLGAWLRVLERDGDWYRVRAFSCEGWVHDDEVTEHNPAVKFFFVDVGQGDATLIETPTERIVVDGGPGSNFYRYLTRYKYRALLDQGFTVHIEAVVVSHFDADHFAGLIALLDDQRFTFGTIYHNGIARFRSRRADRPDQYDTDLGATTDDGAGTRSVLKTTFSTLGQATALRNGGGLMTTFDSFVRAAQDAHAQGRLDGMKRLIRGSAPLAKINDIDTEVLGPVPHVDNSGDYDWFEDSSHTRNGHSVVLKFTAGTRTFLLGGDLNVQAETHLLQHVDPTEFRVDVAKACHHGASEFTTAFLQAVRPKATIISSGDNENYGHPQPDAVGAIGRHSEGDRPLVFSTELARSTTPQRIHYGLINVRTDGDVVVAAQMFEKSRAGDMWNNFVV